MAGAAPAQDRDPADVPVRAAAEERGGRPERGGRGAPALPGARRHHARRRVRDLIVVPELAAAVRPNGERTDRSRSIRPATCDSDAVVPPLTSAETSMTGSP